MTGSHWRALEIGRQGHGESPSTFHREAETYPARCPPPSPRCPADTLSRSIVVVKGRVVVTASPEAVELAKVAAAAAATRRPSTSSPLDVSDQLALTDCFVLASGPTSVRSRPSSTRSRRSCARAAASRPPRGRHDNGWVLLDFNDIVVHVMHTEQRGFYGLDGSGRTARRSRCPTPRATRTALHDAAPVTLLRHGQTEYNSVGRMQGHLDTRLTGTPVARRRGVVAPRLAQERFDRIITSDLTRAHDTATAVAEAVGLPLSVDKRLRETPPRGLAGTHHRRDRCRRPGRDRRVAVRPAVHPARGESRVDVVVRSLPVVEELDLEYASDPRSAPCCSFAHRRHDRRDGVRLIDLPQSSWPVIGGLGNTGGPSSPAVTTTPAGACRGTTSRA
ncbi:RsfS/YbeB/iojap family protein [Pseudonocardia sp. ICBG162]|uniref:RsfS/YbeB/iojap family protein n=1 Tax=Pseudonocardia sp. ICBG162 TaxID=2846761 RepID=UPI0027DFC3D6|nr:RsfS/YbeB/iojap family protein [Pseudonocardia sp. ICBG162]